MDLFCRLFNILNFYAVLAQNTLQFCAQQRIIPHRHVPCQHCLARIPKAEINFYRTPVKNVAEQISAVEESRNITADILKKYLPDYAPSSVPVFRPQAQGEVNEERELLYKVLFDLRNDMNDLKRMMAELMAEHRGYDHKGSDVTALLPRNLPAPVSTPTVHPMPVSFNDYSEPEEVIEEPAAREGLTKEQVLREAIIKALRRHGGKRREAAKDLFISERTLYRKIKELGIDEY